MKSSGAERTYQALRTMILSGELGDGEVVNQTEIAARLGTSRAPVREAVARLVSQRMLTLIPGHGVRVARLSVRDLLEINQLRWLLEGFAARMTAEHVPHATLHELKETAARIAADGTYGPEEVEDLDRRLHEVIAHHCGNERMRDYIDQLDAEMAIARQADVRSLPADMVASIVKIIEALESRDAAAAEREVRAHIDLFSHRIPMLAGRGDRASVSGEVRS